MTAVTYKCDGEVLERFFASDAFVRLVVGPFGSGKATACAIELYRRACAQAPGPDGVRRTRAVVVRSTFRQLQSTVVPSWRSWFDDRFSTFSWSEPFEHRLHFKLPDDTTVHSTVTFLALDGPDAEAKLRGLECTFAWINEAREVGKPILDFLLGRVGRYPAMRDGGPTWCGVIADTNPPSTDDYWYQLAEEERPDNWAVFKQPGGVIRDGGKWIANPHAENLNNLPAGYYLQQIAGQSDDWIRVHLGAEYGMYVPGRPVFTSYVDSIHCAREPFGPTPGVPLVVGVDLGLQPAGTIGQRLLNGQLRISSEIVGHDLGLTAFGEQLSAQLAQWYPGFDDVTVWADPAGSARSSLSDKTPLEVLSAALGRPVRPAPGHNNLQARLEAVHGPLRRMVGSGEPGLLISPAAKTLRRAMAGAYCYKRIATADGRYAEKPDKNEFSHVADSLQYLALGAGEGRTMLGRLERARPVMAAGVGFNPLVGARL